MLPLYDIINNINKQIKGLCVKIESLSGEVVPPSRNLSINGVNYDLSADRSWTVGDILSSGSYSNPSWITSLAWSKLSGVPSTFAPSPHTHPLSDLTQSGAANGQIPQWNGSNWVPVTFSSGWGLTGNSGTNPTTDFIGTIDNQDLVFRRNNLERLRLTNRDNLNNLEFNGSTFRIFNPLGASGLLVLGGGAASQANIQIFGSSGNNSNRILFNLGTTNRATLFSGGQWSFNLPGGALDAFNLYSDLSGTGTLFQVWGAATTRMLYSYQGNLVLGTDISNQVSTAILQLHSTTKGFLLPRQTTTERNAISVPANGLQIYNTTTNTIDLYQSAAWQQLLNTAGGQLVTGQLSFNHSSPTRFVPTIMLNGAGAGMGFWNTNNNSIGVSAGNVHLASFANTGVLINPNQIGSLVLPTTNAALEVRSTTRGFLPPKMTTAERDAVTWVAGDSGMVIYNTTTNTHQGWNGSTWNDFY